ncbi:MAG: hypothetical protein JF607_24260, partial [Burkholderiales bacterium]|nr:hypothetical protein [Burkholderiales bacterium]
MNTTSTTSTTSTKSTTASTVPSSKVEGTNVYNPRGDKLGSIDDLVI